MATGLRAAKEKALSNLTLKTSFKMHLIDKSKIDALALKVQKEKCVLSVPGGLLQQHGLPGGGEQDSGYPSYGCKVFLIWVDL